MDDSTHNGALPHRTSNSSLAGSAYATPSSPGVSSNADTSFHSEPDASPASLRAAPASVPVAESKAKETISKHLHGREKEWAEIAQRKGRLELLDLPLDVLRCIVKEVGNQRPSEPLGDALLTGQITHTNDLTALALTHSALHSLAIPHIYSRFDIVWPEATTTAEPRAGVDALTYGLATLVFAKDVFGEARGQHSQQPAEPCSHCDHEPRPPRPTSQTGHDVQRPSQRTKRRGNNYAQYTKKFSLGNGPPEWVSEYLITKEGGKMLGTLVALAVARMHNLEQFVWDMPTGILRDVWQALASLGDERGAKACRLERVWIRWHNNQQIHGSHPLSTTADAAGQNNMSAQPSYLNRVERPNFSILPPLKSLSVLDVDELAYLDEMSILIERSVERLRELRIGIARHVESAEWVSPWEGEGIPQTSLAAANTGTMANSQKRFGGVLGAVVGRVFDARAYQMALRAARKKSAKTEPEASQASSAAGSTTDNRAADSVQRAGTPRSAGARFVEDLPTPDGSSSEATAESSKLQAYMAGPSSNAHLGRLNLETLEMERVPLSITILSGAIDWTKLRDLTIIDCPFHETLWKLLRRKYTPRLAGDKGSSAPKKTYSDSPSEYLLRLRKLHTNTVTPTFVLFVRAALPPHTLETLFLQQSSVSPTHVEISSIHTYILKRHAASLRHLLIDSTMTPGGSATVGSWRRWLLERKQLSFLTSGRMPRLRELGVAIDQQDWHFLLQRLPNIPHVRSLYLHNIASDRDAAEFGSVASAAARDLALHVLDIVELVPKIELCYLGIANKCFEIMEGSAAAGAAPDELDYADPERPAAGAHAAAAAIDSEDDGDGEDEAEDDEAAAELDGDAEPDDDDEDDDSDTEDDDDDSLGLETCSLEPGQIVSDSEPDEDEAGRAALRLREILFYDDKVLIFRARHGRL